MRLNAIGALPFDVRARVDRYRIDLQLRIGQLQFGLTEDEAIGLANRLVDTVEEYRRIRDLRNGQTSERNDDR